MNEWKNVEAAVNYNNKKKIMADKDLVKNVKAIAIIKKRKKEGKW